MAQGQRDSLSQQSCEDPPRDDWSPRGTSVSARVSPNQKQSSSRSGGIESSLSARHVLYLLLIRICTHTHTSPSHSSHALLCRLCWQMLDPPHSLHWLVCQLCWQIPSLRTPCITSAAPSSFPSRSLRPQAQHCEHLSAAVPRTDSEQKPLAYVPSWGPTSSSDSTFTIASLDTCVRRDSRSAPLSGDGTTKPERSWPRSSPHSLLRQRCRSSDAPALPDASGRHIGDPMRATASVTLLSSRLPAAAPRGSVQARLEHLGPLYQVSACWRCSAGAVDSGRGKGKKGG